MKFQTTIICLIVILFFYACRHEDKQKTSNTVSITKTETGRLVEKHETISQNKETDEPIFPAFAKTVKDFIPEHYNIDLEADGDLNHDGLKDQVMILINTIDTTSQRVALVLLLQNDRSYKLDTKSFGVVEPKYREDGYQNYDFEDISIDKEGVLTITQQATGPNGSLESIYKYINKKLILTDISSFTMGAGGQTELKLDIMKGIFEETDINTMKEDMPSKTTTKKYRIPEVSFENSNPRDMIIKAFDINGVQ